MHDELRDIGDGNLFGLIVTLGCIAILHRRQRGRLKVNGPIYRQIVLGKDPIADILPPPNTSSELT
jgi:hypothetical protein